MSPIGSDARDHSHVFLMPSPAKGQRGEREPGLSDGKSGEEEEDLLPLEEKVPHHGLVLAAISRADSHDECAWGTCEM